MVLNKRLIYVFIATMILLLAACEPAENELPDIDEQLTPTVAPGLPPAAALEAQEWLAERLAVPVEQVEIVETEQVEWPDACLGLGGLDEVCAQVITPGWRVIAQVNGQQYELRTDETGQLIRSPDFAD